MGKFVFCQKIYNIQSANKTRLLLRLCTGSVIVSPLQLWEAYSRIARRRIRGGVKGKLLKRARKLLPLPYLHEEVNWILIWISSLVLQLDFFFHIIVISLFSNKDYSVLLKFSKDLNPYFPKLGRISAGAWTDLSTPQIPVAAERGTEAEASTPRTDYSTEWESGGDKAKKLDK